MFSRDPANNVKRVQLTAQIHTVDVFPSLLYYIHIMDDVWRMFTLFNYSESLKMYNYRSSSQYDCRRLHNTPSFWLYSYVYILKRGHIFTLCLCKKCRPDSLYKEYALFSLSVRPFSAELQHRIPGTDLVVKVRLWNVSVRGNQTCAGVNTLQIPNIISKLSGPFIVHQQPFQRVKISPMIWPTT